MKTFQTIEAAANLKGMAKHTYNRVTTAIAEDTTAAMLHAFAALTDGAKAIALQSGKFSNLYIRGERKGMAAEEAAKELAERAAGCVTRKLRKIDHICAIAFLSEYISRQRKAEETPETPNPDNTPTTMNANETNELTHAGQCLDIYLHNTREIYERYTAPEIADAAARMRINARTSEHLWHACTPESSRVTNAIGNAVALVQTYDHLTPTAKDVEQVTRNYVAYIVECAQYEIKNA